MSDHLPSDSPFQYRIGMLLLPGFNSTAAFAFLDPLRAANYISGKQSYKWQLLSLTSKSVAASNQAVVQNITPLSEAGVAYDLIVVNASWTPEKFQSKKLIQWLNAMAKQGATLAAIDTGAMVLGYAGLLDNYRVTVHYEHAAAFKELFPSTHLEELLYIADRDRLTCCGGLASTDMSLSLVQQHHGLELANAAANYVFKDRHRSGNEPQVQHNPDPVGITMPKILSEAIILMEQNLEEPLSLTELSDYLAISQRQLERNFKKHTGLTPIRYYINVRLDRARGLITQTDIRIGEIASACGFGTAEQFSRSYSKHFKISPSQDRIEGRIPFQFRSFPAYAAV